MFILCFPLNGLRDSLVTVITHRICHFKFERANIYVRQVWERKHLPQMRHNAQSSSKDLKFCLEKSSRKGEKS